MAGEVGKQSPKSATTLVVSLAVVFCKVQNGTKCCFTICLYVNDGRRKGEVAPNSVTAL